MQEELVRFSGAICAVIYQNPENGYSVLKLRDEAGRELTAVGVVPVTNVGERLKLEGRWVRHSAYGEQLEIVTVERLLPEGRIEILAYLSSHAIRGVGPKIAAKLVERFGADTLRVIENEPARLAEISGISEAKAAEIHESFLSQQGLRRLVEFLTLHHLPADLGVRIYRSYGELSMMAIQDNPYFLTEPGFDAEFAAVDAFALELGIDGGDERRIDAGILFELSYNAAAGHVFVPEDQLVAVTADFLGLPREAVSEGLSRLTEAERVIIDPIAGLRAVYLPAYGEAERYLSGRFLQMALSSPTLPSNLTRAIREIEAAQDITYAELQKEAILGAAAEQILLVPGGPGTGKTTTLRGILDLFDRLRLRTLLAAPTGRAAKRLSELTGRDAATIHRLLEVDVSAGQDEMVFVHNAHNPLVCDAVIVDETSMVDLLLMHALVQALPERCRLILVGDPDQLPSVGAGNLFSDLIRCGRIPTVRLTEIFRQARESLIVMNAHEINHGRMPDLGSRDRDFFFLRRGSGQALCQTVTDLCSRRLPEKMGIRPEELIDGVEIGGVGTYLGDAEESDINLFI